MTNQIKSDELRQGIIQTLKIAGFDASELQMLAYPSREALIYSVSGYNTDHHSQLHGDLGNASTNAR